MAVEADITTPALIAARYRLAADTTLLTDAMLLDEMRAVMRGLYSQYPVVTLEGLDAPVAGSSGNDGDSFVEAVGLLTAARLYSSVQAARAGGLTREKEGTLEAQYAGVEAPKAVQEWIDQAEAALLQIAAIAQASTTAETVTEFNPFRMSGPRRATQAAGYRTITEYLRRIAGVSL